MLKKRSHKLPVCPAAPYRIFSIRKSLFLLLLNIINNWRCENGAALFEKTKQKVSRHRPMRAPELSRDSSRTVTNVFYYRIDQNFKENTENIFFRFF